MVEQGLASNRVTCILQDNRGFMWIGTENGLHKYDGYKFTVYKPEPGNPRSISHTFIFSLFEDDNEDIWIGTYGGGLDKFDRDTESFSHHQHDPGNPYSLSNNFVSAICQIPADSGDALWIGTRWGGLNKLELKTGKFYRYFTENGIISSIKLNNIFTITCDQNGSVWIGTDASGLIALDPQTKNFAQYKADITDEEDLCDNKIKSIFADKSGNIWIGTVKGLNKFDTHQNKFTRYIHNPGDKNSLSHNHVLTIYEDRQDNLWVGTFHGLNLYDKSKGTFKRFNSDWNRQSAISHDYITKIYEDRSGILWITTHGGINKVDPKAKEFNHIRIALENSAKASINSIRCMQEDIKDNNFLWIGTSGAGLIRYSREDNQYRHMYGKDETVFVRSLYQSPLFPEDIWIATWGSGLIKVDKNLKELPRKVFWFDNANFKDANHISAIYGLSDDKILLGTGFGFYQFNLMTKEHFGFIPKSNDPNSLSQPNVTSICRDKAGAFWLGTYGGGLNKYILPSVETDLSKRAGKFVHYKHKADDPGSLSSNTITVIYQAQDGRIWIGTLDGGLNQYIVHQDKNSNTIKEEFIHYSEKDGLPSDAILGILEDNNGNLWISTKKGLSKFNPSDQSFRNYDMSDGLQSNEFNRFAYYKNNRGELYFGGINGFNHFQPEMINDNSILPEVVLTDFQIFNKSIKPGPDSQFNKSVSESDEIILNHDQTVFTLEFAALEYTRPVKNKFAYKMEGIDPDWVYTDASRRFATYTHLDPGEYTFNVRASNNDGVWNHQGKSVRIIITPPWWQTKIAYLSYIIFGLSLIYSLRRYELNRQKFKHDFELEHMEAEKLKEVDRIKSRFFANISHEFRTPLTLILGPLSKLAENESDENKKQCLSIMKRNSDRLLQLINQLLDFSRLESGEMNLLVRESDIVSFVKGILMSFRSLADQKNIAATFISSKQKINMYFDYDKVEKIFVNLLSNAFKFTPENGRIVVGIKNGEKEIIIKVKDSGIGIPHNKIPYIFDRFYQADDSLTRNQEGTGIGLALTKELVELHRGKIEVKSELNQGTEFAVTFLKGKAHLNPDEIFNIEYSEGTNEIESSVKERDLFEYDVPQKLNILKSVTEYQHPGSKIPDHLLPVDGTGSPLRSDEQRRSSIQNPTILIVEDNPDMNLYISEALKDEYRVQSAFDGQEGLELARRGLPDLIITDLMMPKTDGYRLCHKIKIDEKTSHIPVILLTAKAEQQDKLTGLQLGADDYLIKPFDTRELQVRVRNLIEQRQKLREKFMKKLIVEPGEIAVSSMDETFLKKAFNIVKDNLANGDFDTHSFARKIGISRSHLNVKLKSLTGLATREFIREMRLKHAARLISANHATISEIAYQVGFNSLSHFSKIFKNTFGVLPSDYYTQVKS
jgi:signal transduction histidine kinase/ligand-binding sensor domain-containing protein/AraC-like DNA-binding protein/AmiR/NasT family two-component response regulator